MAFDWEATKTCRASLGSDLFIQHTCGVEGQAYVQVERHFHDGNPCEDWSHCTRTSDQQR